MTKTGPDFEKISICPHCGHRLNVAELAPAHPDAATAKPSKGDFGVCIQCGGFMVYTDEQGAVRAMEPQDMASNPELIDELMDVRLNILKIHKK